MMERRAAKPFVERLGLIVGCALTALFAFETIAPYFLSIPQSSLRLIDQQQTILQSVFMVLVGYLWRDAEGSRVKNETIATLAKTAQNAGAALAAPPTPDVTLQPGDTATVSAAPTGDTP
jgi:hypothetical protein